MTGRYIDANNASDNEKRAHGERRRRIKKNEVYMCARVYLLRPIMPDYSVYDARKIDEVNQGTSVTRLMPSAECDDCILRTVKFIITLRGGVKGDGTQLK